LTAFDRSNQSMMHDMPVADTPRHRSSPSYTPLLGFSPNRAMEEKNSDNLIGDGISDARTSEEARL
jgi:hypothetical protein